MHFHLLLCLIFYDNLRGRSKQHTYRLHYQNEQIIVIHAHQSYFPPS